LELALEMLFESKVALTLKNYYLVPGILPLSGPLLAAGKE